MKKDKYKDNIIITHVPLLHGKKFMECTKTSM